MSEHGLNSNFNNNAHFKMILRSYVMALGNFVPSHKMMNRDPIFEPFEGKGKTYAEMDKDEKNKISHRGRSFSKLQAFLNTVKF